MKQIAFFKLNFLLIDHKYHLFFGIECELSSCIHFLLLPSSMGLPTFSYYNNPEKYISKPFFSIGTAMYSLWSSGFVMKLVEELLDHHLNYKSHQEWVFSFTFFWSGQWIWMLANNGDKTKYRTLGDERNLKKRRSLNVFLEQVISTSPERFISALFCVR